MNDRVSTNPLRTAPSRQTSAVILSQLVAALGILIQFVAAPDHFAEVLGVPFPPGLIYIAGASVVVWLDQGSTWSPMGAIALSLWIVFGGLGSGDLTANLTSSNTMLVVGNIVMVIGLVLSCVAGGVVIGRNRRVASEPLPAPLSARNPRRRAHVSLVLLLGASAVTLAFAESFEFQGAGPFPFLVLAVLTAFVHGRYMVGIAIVFAIVYFGSAVTNPAPTARLSEPSETLAFVSTALHLLSLLGAIAAGVIANAPPERTPPTDTTSATGDR